MKIVSDILVSDGTKFHSLRNRYAFTDKANQIKAGCGVYSGEEFYVLSPVSSESKEASLIATYKGMSSSYLPQISLKVSPIFDGDKTMICSVFENNVLVGTVTQSINLESVYYRYKSPSGDYKNFQEGKTYYFSVQSIGGTSGNVGSSGAVYLSSNSVQVPNGGNKVTLFQVTTGNTVFNMTINTATPLLALYEGKSITIPAGEHITSINLYGDGVVSVTGYPNALISVDLATTDVKSIILKPEITSQFSLDLSTTKITEFAGVKALKSLKIHTNLALTKINLEQCENLTYLDVSRTGITLVEGISKCTKVEELNVSYTNIGQLGLDNLRNLRILTAINTQVQHLSVAYAAKLEKVEAQNSERLFSILTPDTTTFTYLNLAHTAMDVKNGAMSTIVRRLPNRTGLTAGRLKLRTTNFTTAQLQELNTVAKTVNWTLLPSQ